MKEEAFFSSLWDGFDPDRSDANLQDNLFYGPEEEDLEVEGMAEGEAST